MHSTVMDFLNYVYIHRPDYFKGKRILEVGSFNDNGTPRTVFQKSASEYIGVDMQQGKDVDKVVPAAQLVTTFGEQSFDVVVSTEMLEHCLDWAQALDQMWIVLKVGGVLVLTARGPGFPHHGYPDDCWRFTIHDFLQVFEDSEILMLESDPLPGVMLMVKKGVWSIHPYGITVEEAPK